MTQLGVVYLGFPGPWAKNSCESSDHYTTKIGGVPDWPSKEVNIKPDLLACRVCSRSLCLVAQVYAPLSLNGVDLEERTIYVFGCPMAECASSFLSWRVLRIQKCQTGNNVENVGIEKTLMDSVVTTSNASLSNKDLLTFDSKVLDDENYNDMDLDELSRALSRATSAASNCRKQFSSMKDKQPRKCSKAKGRVADVCIPALPCFYIYSQEEVRPDSIGNVSASYLSLSISESQKHSTETNDEEKWEGEVYEYDKALQADRTYLKFKKQVDLFPEQCFRYSFGGMPLLASANAGEPGTCTLCGAARHYEMQLMSALLYFLQEDANGATANPKEWDWATVIIYTCSNSCSFQSREEKSSTGFWTVVEEVVAVQD